MYRTHTMTRVAALAASFACLTFLAGCGGDDNNDNDLLGTGVGSTVSRYAGTYNSTVVLPNSMVGTTNIVVAPNGTCTGTFTVASRTSSTRQATSFSFGVGTYAISGTVDPTTGAFQMTGNAGGQPFSYNGTLPTPGNYNVGGSYTITAGGQTYTSSFTPPDITPISITPISSPAPSPVVSPSPVAPPSGTPIAITFSAIDGVQNVDTSDFNTANNTLLGAYPFGAGSTSEFLSVIVNSSVAGSTDANRSRRFVVQFRTVTPAVGSSFTIPTANGEGVQFYQFEDNDGVSPSGRLYNGTGGTVTVVARTATSITVRVSNVTLTPGNYIAGLPTTGAFVANGEITAPIIPPK